METWVVVSVVIAAVAIVFQAAMLAMMFVQMRKTVDKVEHLTTDSAVARRPDSHARSDSCSTTPSQKSPKWSPTPLTSSTSRAARRKSSIASSAKPPTASAARLVTTDRILTGTLETVEEAGSQFKRGVWAPMQKASAIISGIKVGLDFLRSRRGTRRRTADDADVEDGEELFI